MNCQTCGDHYDPASDNHCPVCHKGSPSTTRDKLAEVIREVWRSGKPFRPGGSIDFAAFADALLASGVVCDSATRDALESMATAWMRSEDRSADYQDGLADAAEQLRTLAAALAEEDPS